MGERYEVSLGPSVDRQRDEDTSLHTFGHSHVSSVLAKFAMEA